MHCLNQSPGIHPDTTAEDTPTIRQPYFRMWWRYLH